MTDHDPGDTFCCLDCNSSITVGSNGVEYGHERGAEGGETRCPRRPKSVDPTKGAHAHNQWTGPDDQLETEWVLKRRRNRAVYHVDPNCPNVHEEVVQASEEDKEKLDECQICSKAYDGPVDQTNLAHTLENTDADAIGGGSDV